jgi:ABC-type spermidine/putrescine transport system permease subunit I
MNRPAKPPLTWLGLVPFALFALLFLILPTMKIVTGAFQTPDGAFTLANLIGLNTDSIRNAYWVSVKLSLVTARLAQIPAQPFADLLRGRIELRRGAARLRLPRDARTGRPHYVVAAQQHRH